MQRTANLNLCQWEADDRIMRTDFNDAMASIDAGVKAANDAIAAKADASALTALQNAMPHIVTGSYTGSGNTSGASKSISLGHRPKFVFVWKARSASEKERAAFGDGIAFYDNYDATRLHAEVTNSGFKVYSVIINGVLQNPDLNANVQYHYMAMY